MSSDSADSVRLEFDIAPVRIPVRIDGKGYVLEKASAASAAQWRSELLKRATLGEDGSVRGLDAEVAGLDFPLLASCLSHAELDEQGNVVKIAERLTVDEVKALPNDAFARLAERAKKISGMEAQGGREAIEKQIEELQKKLVEMDAEDPVKNLPSSTTDGSG